MKILIVGSDINAKLLASYLKIENNSHDVYLTTEENAEGSIYTPIDIQESDVYTICDFVKYNQIEYTIVTSPIAIINGIAEEFKKEGFGIFAPASEAARVTFFTSIAKKIIYKLKMPTPRFGIFDRENIAIDYIRNAKFPIEIDNDFTLFSNIREVYNSFSKAKLGIQKIFEEGNNKIIIENSLCEEPIYMYFITDGYNALPLISLTREEKENYTKICTPASKITERIIQYTMQRIIFPLLDDISKYAEMYVGIIGLKIKIHNNSVFLLEFYNGFQQYDFQAFLPLIGESLFNLIYDASNSGLIDNRDFVNLKDLYSYTVVINKNDIINVDDDCDDFIVTEDKEKCIITASSPTLNQAKNKMFDYLNAILSPEAIESIMKSEIEKELRV